MTVSMKKCMFTGQPYVFTAVTCTSECWKETSLGLIVTENNVMNSKEFKLYLRTESAVSLETTRNYNFKIQ